MRARPWWLAGLVVLVTSAHADPEPKPIDSKPFRDQLVVLRDERGGIYVVLRSGDDQRAWYGNGKALYEQIIVGSSSDGTDGSWELDVWVPRVSGVRPGTIRHNADGSYVRYCTPDEGSTMKLALVPADQAKHLFEKSALMTSALVHKAHLLARDETGTYYYIDEFRKQYGEGGYRVFVGKKGAMRQLPLTDIATDTGGEVFATKSGDIRLVYDRDADNTSSKSTIAWVQGDKRTQLVMLDLQMNAPVIYKGLGVYSFVGTICDDL